MMLELEIYRQFYRYFILENFNAFSIWNYFENGPMGLGDLIETLEWAWAVGWIGVWEMLRYSHMKPHRFNSNDDRKLREWEDYSSCCPNIFLQFFHFLLCDCLAWEGERKAPKWAPSFCLKASLHVLHHVATRLHQKLIKILLWRGKYNSHHPSNSQGKVCMNTFDDLGILPLITMKSTKSRNWCRFALTTWHKTIVRIYLENLDISKFSQVL